MKRRIAYKKVLFLVCFSALFICSRAQEVIVKGRLVDSASTKPIPVATINFQEPEKKISRTVISDQSGEFQMNLLPGKYRVMITHGSFRRKVLPLKVEGEPIDLGTMQLVTMVKNMAGVTVTASKPLVE